MSIEDALEGTITQKFTSDLCWNLS